MVEKKRKLKPGQLYWEILKVIGIGIAASSGNPLRPTLPLMAREVGRLLRENTRADIGEDSIWKSLLHLEKKDVIDLVERGDKAYVYLKDTGNFTITEYSIKTLLDFKKKNKQWNGKWFLVFFDVPEIQRKKRDILRKYLLKIGFYRYQKSIYLFPYECEQEISLIKKMVEGAKYMKYVIADKIEDESEAKTYFHLS